MGEKIKPVPFQVHPKFRKLIFTIQQERVNAGKESIDKKISCWRLTKTISNMIESNEELFKSLVEVEINV